MKNNFKILFICLGNICRSPAAEGIMKKYIEEDSAIADKIKIDSAGLISYHEGELPDSRMRLHAAKRGYKLTHLSRPITQNDFEEFDLIIGMDSQNISKLQKMAHTDAHREKIFNMTDFLVNKTTVCVPDPYYGGSSGFENVLDILEDSCLGLLNYLKDNID
jgi:Protein-tyrosine-phosphatase